jgi:flagellar hook-length control protein FliK
VNLPGGNRDPGEQRGGTGALSAPGRAFEDLLARELHQNLNGDIVRHASIILRDGEAGTVRLSLRPESLGNVKIRLEMAENKITGHIVVESGEALRAFEREIRSLEQAFRESGFESARLDMSLASGGGGENGAHRGDTRGEGFYSERLAASFYETATETAGLSEPLSPLAAGPGREAVNMLV